MRLKALFTNLKIQFFAYLSFKKPIKTYCLYKKFIKNLKMYIFIAGGAKPPQTPRILFGSVGRPIGRSVGSAGDAKKQLKNRN